MRWQAIRLLLLIFFSSVVAGVSLLTLIPLLNLVNVGLKNNSVNAVSKYFESFFSFLHIQPTLITILVFFIVINILRHWLTAQVSISSFHLQRNFAVTLQKRLYRAIIQCSWFFLLQQRTANFAHSILAEAQRTEIMVSSFLRLISDFLVALLYIYFAMQLSFYLTMTSVGCGLFIAFLLRKKVTNVRKAGELLSSKNRDLFALVGEQLSGLKITKIYGLESRQLQEFSDINAHVYTTRWQATYNQASRQFYFAVFSVISVCIFVYLALEVLYIPVEEMLLLMFIFSRIIPLFSRSQSCYQRFVNSLPAFINVMSWYEKCLAHSEDVHSNLQISFEKSIEIDSVSFCYSSKGCEALSNISLTIHKGETVAIVGHSGAGKSTLADLLTGLLIVKKGKIIVDSKVLAGEHLANWRQKTSYVTQDIFLFNDSIRNNLLCANPNASDEEMIFALQNAFAYEFVMKLAHKLDTKIGERGVRLSGGQKQRIALAQALLRKPHLLILDEATSSLDSESEAYIQKSIENLHGEMTIVVIAHRLSTIANADNIYVLKNSRIVESGSREKLLAQHGTFYRMWQQQQN